MSTCNKQTVIYLIGGAVIVALALGSTWLTMQLFAATGYPLTPPDPTPQPVDYPHSRHLALGMDCEACHTGARTAAHAGIPPTRFCASCHGQAAAQGGANPAAPTPAAMQTILNAGQEIPWHQFQRTPRHVRFSHERHVTQGGLDCQECHGDMSKLEHAVTTGYFPRHLRGMNRCVNCHLEHQVTSDCLACHR